MKNYTYEIKAPNVIHLLVEGMPRREIRLDSLYVENFNDRLPLAMVFKLSTDHKDIKLPSKECVLYVERPREVNKKYMDTLVDLIVKEILEVIRQGDQHKFYLLSEHKTNYAMRPATDSFRIGKQFGSYSRGRFQAHFVPSRLSIDTFAFKIMANASTGEKTITVEKSTVINPLKSTHVELLRWAPDAVILGVDP